MRRLNLIVEGQSEETFVRDVFAPYLAQFDIFATARCINTTKKKIVTRVNRGGVTNYDKAKTDIERWLSSDQRAYVSTMLDLYALPADFPGMQGHALRGLAKAQHIQTELATDLGNARFVPYVMLHEFEALILTAPRVIDEVIPGSTGGAQLEVECAPFTTPEDINDGPTTAPSKRILRCCPGYNKVLHGSRITNKLGIDNVRTRCPHFSNWITTLTNLPVIS